MPEIAAVPERITTPEFKKASKGLMLHLANGESDSSKTAGLNKKPAEIAQKTYDALGAVTNAERKRQQDDIYEQIRKSDAADPNIKTETPPELLREFHFTTWARKESQRIKGMFAKQQESLDSMKAIQHSLEKLHIMINITDEGKVDVRTLQDQLYKPAPAGKPGDFYNTFCEGGNMNQKLLNALDEQDIVLLKDFLTDTVGGKAEYDALLATKQTQNALQANTDFSTGTAVLNENEKPILAVLQKGEALLAGKPIAKNIQQNEQIQLSQPTSEPKPNLPVRPVTPEEPNEQKPETAQAPTATSPEQNSVQVAAATEQGPHEYNDDNFFLDATHLRGGIFDGAGGYNGGYIASKAARDAIEQTMAVLSPTATEEEVTVQMREAFAKANDAVMAKQKETGNDQASTTASVFQVIKSPNGSEKLIVGTIGDSSIWIRRADGSLAKVTADGGGLRNDYLTAMRHASTPEKRSEIQAAYERLNGILASATSMDELAQNGLTNAQIERYWKRRNATNLLGSPDALAGIGFEIFTAQLNPGDVVFATTDGVHDNLSTNEITKVIQKTNNPNELAKSLVAQAKEVADTFKTDEHGVKIAGDFRAKPDDITAIALSLESTATINNQEQQSKPLVINHLTDRDFQQLALAIPLPQDASKATPPLGISYGNIFGEDDVPTLAGKFLTEVYSSLTKRADAEELAKQIPEKERGGTSRQDLEHYVSYIDHLNEQRKRNNLPLLPVHKGHESGQNDFHFNEDLTGFGDYPFYFNKGTSNYNPPYNPNEKIVRAYVTVNPLLYGEVTDQFVNLTTRLFDAGIDFSAKASGPYGTVTRDENMVFYIRESDTDKAAPLIRQFLQENNIGEGHVRAASADKQNGLSWAMDLSTTERSMLQQITGSTNEGSYNLYVATRIMPYYLQRLAVQYRQFAQNAALPADKRHQLLSDASSYETEALRVMQIIQNQQTQSLEK